jgi:pseudaminic acid synthase
VNRNKSISIAGARVGLACEPYIIAELSANHNGSIDKAIATIDMAKKMGANAIKLQTYTADTLTIACKNDDFLIREGLWEGQYLYDLYQEAHTPFEWHSVLFEHAEKVGITCFSSPFDETAVDLLESLDAPAYKIASFELVDIPLIRYVAKTGKPMIMSTGMANLVEIEEAVSEALSHGCSDLILLHCVSGYPAPIEQSNIRTVADLAERFDLITGLSDHTLGTEVAVASVALGACVIEKHVTLCRSDSGPDSVFSLEPHELKKLCVEAKNAWLSLGVSGYDRKPIEVSNVKFRRSIYVVNDIAAGEEFTTNNIRRIRPGYGLAPKLYEGVLGKIAVTALKKGTALLMDHIAK